MAKLVRIQFKVDEFHLNRSSDEVYVFTKSQPSSYTRKSSGVKNKISNSKAAIYVEFPQPPHASVGSEGIYFAVSIAAVFNRYSYANSVVIDAINVVNTDRSPDNTSYEQELSNIEKLAIKNYTIEEIVDSPTIINGTNVSDNGQRYNDGTGNRTILFNVTYNELASLPVIPDPGETWVNPSSLVSYSISNSLIGCTTNNDASSVSEGSSYSATITADTGYHFESANVSITMGGNLITPTFASDNKSFTISIPSVTSSVSITANATYDTPVSTYYTVTNELTRCSSNNAATQVPEGSSFTARLQANSGYYFYTGNVVITMGQTRTTPTLNKNGTYNISIPEVTGNVVITALASAEPPEPSAWSAQWEEIPTPNSPYDVVSSSIHQTADKIELKVSAEDLVGTLNSQLTIASNLIHLYSDGKIVIEGENFNLDANGHMTAAGATLKSERSLSGNTYGITIADGKISFDKNEYGTSAISFESYNYRDSLKMESNHSVDILADDYASIGADVTAIGYMGGKLYLNAPEVYFNTSPYEASSAFVQMEFVDVYDPSQHDYCPYTDIEFEYDQNTGYVTGLDEYNSVRTSFFRD